MSLHMDIIIYFGFFLLLQMSNSFQNKNKLLLTPFALLFLNRKNKFKEIYLLIGLVDTKFPG